MTRLLVVAKAPVPGEVKTRLGADLGMDAAADVAAAALLDTLRAGAAAFPPDRRHLALAGNLREARRAAEIADALRGWDVFEQEGAGFAGRLVHAHAALAAHRDPVVQIGMDTPQVTAQQLLDVASTLASEDPTVDAVLGRADDGGWWVLGLRDGHHAAPLVDVAMSRATTYDDTRRALEATGLRVAPTATLRDVDTLGDAEEVAAAAPDSAFAAAWRRVPRG